MGEGMKVVVGGGLDSISLVQNEHMNLHRMTDEELVAMHPDAHMPMPQTAEVVAKRYKIGRESMDEYGLQSQQRTAAAYAEGKYAVEIVPVTCNRITWDKETGEQGEEQVTLTADEGLRETTAEGLAGLKTVIEGGTITAGNKYAVRDPGAFAESAGRRAALLAYEQACIGPEDIDVAEVHDATAFAEIQQIENLGFCALGGGGPLTESGATRLGGTIPVNTSGGLVSKGHPIAATGIVQLHELVTQLRGEAGKRQVSDARFAAAENGGGFLGVEDAATVVTVLAKD